MQVQCLSGVLVRESADGKAASDLYTATMAVRAYLSNPSPSSASSTTSTMSTSSTTRVSPLTFVWDRVDIAAATDADGVVLAANGLPVVVAKGQVGEGKVVGRVVGGADGDAVEEGRRVVAEGAGVVVVEVGGGLDVGAVRRGQVSGSSVPVWGVVGVDGLQGVDVGGLDGVVVPWGTGVGVEALKGVKARLESREERKAGTEAEAEAEMQMETEIEMARRAGNAETLASPTPEQATASMSTSTLGDVLSTQRERLIARQKMFLQGLIEFLDAATPALEEVSLLRDSLKQLDELFLVVIVGEFNSGKSAVVNAMLGNSVVPEGILPTTNEITVIKYAESPALERVEQDVDGLFVRYTSAELLKEINIVDTPGTNVILERQQRLTEEFIPRADLVLFVLSADRPFTDSEVKFLKYVRQWGKKVVFVVNKVDLLGSNEDVEKVVEFVEKNATRLLGVEGAMAIPVSAKLATQAKIESRKALGDDSSNVLTLDERSYLANLDAWKASRFGSLETHIRDFLLGGGSGIGIGSDTNDRDTGVTSESLRLKLQTPLFVADALINAAKTQLETELSVLRRDESSVRMVSSQLDAFRDEMGKEAKVQKAEIIQQTDRMVDMISNVVDQLLTVSNWQALLPYYTTKKPDGLGKASAALSTQDVSKDAMSRVNSIVEEHHEWLRVNCQRVCDNYRGFVSDRMTVYGGDGVSGGVSNESPAFSTTTTPTTPTATTATSTTPTENATTASTVRTIDMKTIASILEAEIQTAVKSSVNTFASAILFSLVLTSILPTTLEDLLAIGLGAAFAYASVLNIPVRRMEAKKKVKDEVRRLVEAVHSDMDAEERVRMEECVRTVGQLVQPLDDLLRADIQRLEGEIGELNGRFESALEELRAEI